MALTKVLRVVLCLRYLITMYLVYMYRYKLLEVFSCQVMQKW